VCKVRVHILRFRRRLAHGPSRGGGAARSREKFEKARALRSAVIVNYFDATVAARSSRVGFSRFERRNAADVLRLLARHFRFACRPEIEARSPESPRDFRATAAPKPPRRAMPPSRGNLNVRDFYATGRETEAPLAPPSESESKFVISLSADERHDSPVSSASRRFASRRSSPGTRELWHFRRPARRCPRRSGNSPLETADRSRDKGLRKVRVSSVVLVSRGK